MSRPYDKQALVPFAEYPPLGAFDFVRRRFEGVRFFCFDASTLPLATRAGRAGVLLCNEGYATSLAAATLQDLGLRRATDVIGGFQAWRAAGLPVDPP